METNIEVPTKAATEPSVIVSTLIALVGALFVLLRAFFPDFLTLDQEAAITGVLVIALPLIVGFIVRGKVTANANVVERLSSSGFIVAGAANEIVETGGRIRALLPVGDVEPQHALEEPLD